MDILHVLSAQAGHPFTILPHDILRTADEHRRGEQHRCPKDERKSETNFVPREKKESQPHDAIEFHQRTHDDEAGCPEIAFPFYEEKRGDDDGSNCDIELLHEKRREQRFRTKPEDEEFSAVCQSRASDGKIERERKGHEPKKHSQSNGHHCKGRDDEREERTVMIHVEIFGWIGLVERQTLNGVPKDAAENQKIVIRSVQFEHSHQRKQ